MISVAEALSAIFDLVAPVGTEDVALGDAHGRALAAPVAAKLNQPPFASSVMDGYAVRNEDVKPGARLTVIAEAAAGHGATAQVNKGQAIRIFTGAPLPQGADRVVIQEDVSREGDIISFGQRIDTKTYIRPAGADFVTGDTLKPGRLLTPSDLALIASMGHVQVTVSKKPAVAIIATGDELVAPGETPGPDQIIASNGVGLAALISAAGGVPRLLPIARDTEASLNATFDLARGADLIVTIGGASVGDHDLVAKVGQSRGLTLNFYKVAMRPGKPLMAGMIGGIPMIGLPGNPVSSMVCGHVFIAPALRAMQGLKAEPVARETAELAVDLGANGPREHYMRARIDDGRITPAERQDSGLLKVLSDANCLMIRPPHDRERSAGETVEYTKL